MKKPPHEPPCLLLPCFLPLAFLHERRPHGDMVTLTTEPLSFEDAAQTLLGVLCIAARSQAEALGHSRQGTCSTPWCAHGVLMSLSGSRTLSCTDTHLVLGPLVGWWRQGHCGQLVTTLETNNLRVASALAQQGLNVALSQPSNSSKMDVMPSKVQTVIAQQLRPCAASRSTPVKTGQWPGTVAESHGSLR